MPLTPTFNTVSVNRKTMFSILENTSMEDLHTIPANFSNHLFWNIAHTMVTQQLLVYKLSSLPMLVSEDLVKHYSKGTSGNPTPNENHIEEVKELFFATHERTIEDYNRGRFKTYTPYTNSLNLTLNTVEDAIHFNTFHEGIHLGYAMALRKALKA